MKNIKPGESRLWKYINRSHITKEKIRDLTDFKRSDVNFKIALWNPRSNGMKYFKTLLYCLVTSVSGDVWRKIAKIKNRNVGSPITVKYNGEEISMDYLQAVFELEYMEKHIGLDNLSVLEIGAGYGRTCHSIMANHKVRSYSIIDLENCLELCRRYLKRVLANEDFKKINFVLVKNLNLLDRRTFDLCINIDSFAEMNPRDVKYYLKFINRHCAWSYVKNPLGKYLDKLLDGHSRKEKVVQLALRMGVLREIIDIFDNREVESQVSKFIKVYRPAARWRCIAASWARPWSYFWQAVYKRLDPKQKEHRHVSKV